MKDEGCAGLGLVILHPSSFILSSAAWFRSKCYAFPSAAPLPARDSRDCCMDCLRKALCVAVCGLALASAPPPAYAASVIPAQAGTQRDSHVRGNDHVTPHLVLADSWSWSEFWKFWKRQLDKTAGVVGVVLLVGAGAT